MTKIEEQQIIEMIDSVVFGEVVIKKEAGKIITVYETHSRKLIPLVDPKVIIDKGPDMFRV